MNTRDISGSKGSQFIRLTKLPPSCTDCLAVGNLSVMESSRPVQACKGTALFYFANIHSSSKFVPSNVLPTL
jgi:hypothetical protein